jgi:hypothetical protein
MSPFSALDFIVRLWAKPAQQSWDEQAMGMLTKFAKQHRLEGKFFSAEEFSQYAIKNGLPQPDKKSSWGSLFTKARVGMIIFHTGESRISLRPSAKGRRISLWC